MDNTDWKNPIPPSVRETEPATGMEDKRKKGPDGPYAVPEMKILHPEMEENTKTGNVVEKSDGPREIFWTEIAADSVGGTYVHQIKNAGILVLAETVEGSATMCFVPNVGLISSELKPMR